MSNDESTGKPEQEISRTSRNNGHRPNPEFCRHYLAQKQHNGYGFGHANGHVNGQFHPIVATHHHGQDFGFGHGNAPLFHNQDGFGHHHNNSTDGTTHNRGIGFGTHPTSRPTIGHHNPVHPTIHYPEPISNNKPRPVSVSASFVVVTCIILILTLSFFQLDEVVHFAPRGSIPTPYIQDVELPDGPFANDNLGKFLKAYADGLKKKKQESLKKNKSKEKKNEKTEGEAGRSTVLSYIESNVVKENWPELSEADVEARVNDLVTEIKDNGKLFIQEEELAIANRHGLRKQDKTPVRTAKEAVKAIYNSKMDGIESARPVLDHFTTI